MKLYNRTYNNKLHLEIADYCFPYYYLLMFSIILLKISFSPCTISTFFTVHQMHRPVDLFSYNYYLSYYTPKVLSDVCYQKQNFNTRP